MGKSQTAAWRWS